VSSGSSVVSLEVDGYDDAAHGRVDVLHKADGIYFRYYQDDRGASDSFTFHLPMVVLMGGSTSFRPLLWSDMLFGYRWDRWLLARYLERGERILFDTGWVVHLGVANVSLSFAADTARGLSALSIRQNVIIDLRNAASSVIQPDPAAPSMRLFHIEKGGHLTLRNVSVQGGVAAPSDDGAGVGGAFFNEGAVDFGQCHRVRE